VGRKASTDPLEVLIPWYKGPGLATIVLGFVAMPFVFGLKHFTHIDFFLGFKYLPSMKRSSLHKMIIRKNKQVRLALPIVRGIMEFLKGYVECVEEEGFNVYKEGRKLRKE
jgi:hypothetical protein